MKLNQFELINIRLKNNFENYKKNNLLIVDNKQTIELLNIKFSYSPIFYYLDKLLIPPVEEEQIERNHIIKRTFDQVNNFKQDFYNRRSCFSNCYDNLDNHCLSYFHFYIRNNKLNLFVYVRSQNFDTNFEFDNQTFNLAYYKLYNELKNIYNSDILNIGKIYVHIFSLHKYI